MITIEEKFDVPWPAPIVWSVLSAPDEVVSCVEGAAIGDRSGDGTFPCSLIVKFGPLRVTFSTKVSLTLDEPAYQGRIEAAGKDRQGGTRVRTKADFRIVPDADGSGSVVALSADVQITGKLASVIESGASTVVARMTTEFAARLSQRCADLVSIDRIRGTGVADVVFGEQLAAVGAALATVGTTDQSAALARIGHYVATESPLTETKVLALIDELVAWGNGSAELSRRLRLPGIFAHVPVRIGALVVGCLVAVTLCIVLGVIL